MKILDDTYEQIKIHIIEYYDESRLKFLFIDGSIDVPPSDFYVRDALPSPGLH